MAIGPLLQITYGLLIASHVVLVMIELQIGVFSGCAGRSSGAAATEVKVKLLNTKIKLNRLIPEMRFTVMPPSANAQST